MTPRQQLLHQAAIIAQKMKTEDPGDLHDVHGMRLHFCLPKLEASGVHFISPASNCNGGLWIHNEHQRPVAVVCVVVYHVHRAIIKFPGHRQILSSTASGLWGIGCAREGGGRKEGREGSASLPRRRKPLCEEFLGQLRASHRAARDTGGMTYKRAAA